MISVGFTGTRKGMTRPQREKVKELLSETSIVYFNHGDCIGADAEAHDICEIINHSRAAGERIYITIYPPNNPKNRAFKKAASIRDERSYFERNIDIIDASDVMLACPRGMSEEYRGSGTWHAIRHSRTRKTRCIIIWPNGKIETREPQ